MTRTIRLAAAAALVLAAIGGLAGCGTLTGGGSRPVPAISATHAAPAPSTASPAAAPSPAPTTPQQLAQSIVGGTDANGMTVEKADANDCDAYARKPCPVTTFPSGDETVKAYLTFNDSIGAPCTVTYHAADGSTTFNCPGD